MSDTTKESNQKDTQNEPRSTNKGIRVFVYGTLKKGHYNHSLLEQGKAEFLGRAVLKGPFYMVSLTHYPGVVRCDEASDNSVNSIYGEVYRIDNECLYSLDILEGNGRFYTRQKIWVDDTYKNTWVYTLPESAKKQFQPIEEGVWLPNNEEQTFIETCQQASGQTSN